MFDDYYDDSMRLDEMQTAEDYNRFEEREVFKDHAVERAEMAERDTMEFYGLDALCKWCEDRGYENVGYFVADSPTIGDILHCPTCEHEWVAMPSGSR